MTSGGNNVIKKKRWVKGNIGWWWRSLILFKALRDDLVDERWHLNRNLKEVRDRVMWLPEGRIFQAEVAVSCSSTTILFLCWSNSWPFIFLSNFLSSFAQQTGYVSLDSWSILVYVVCIHTLAPLLFVTLGSSSFHLIKPLSLGPNPLTWLTLPLLHRGSHTQYTTLLGLLSY